MSDSGEATAAEAVGAEVNGKAELQSVAPAVSASEGALKCKKKKKRKEQEADMKEMGVAQQEEAAGTAAVSALEETPKRKKKKKKKQQEADMKVRGTAEQKEAVDTAAVSASEGPPKSKKKKEAKAKEKEMAEQEAITAAVSALEGAPKSKKKKEAKAKQWEMAEQEATTAAVLALEGAPKSKKEVKAKERELAKQEATTAAVLASKGPLKCMKKKKEKAKETGMDELEPSAAISASEGAQNCKNKEDRDNENGLAKQEAAAVSELEGTPKRKKKLKKENKMQEHHESPQALLDHVVADKIVANESVNAYTKGEGEVGNSDVSMDPINGEDPNCSVAKYSDAKVNCKAGEGNKNGNSLQESCVDRKRLRKRPKRKRKQGSSSRGPGISSQDGDRVVTQSLYSSTDHDLSCICASCLVQAHKEKVKNIYSPRGSLVRFERKKLLILDLNGLLADINMDYQNAHMAHAKVKAKLVFKRPYCNDFLRFCFQNFELGIWSSRNKDNVNSVVNILMRDLKQYLLFCWDMSNCTVTGCNTVDNKHKPLVLKELKKLWNKEDPNLPWEQGEFSPSNTLLVDDSPYKALCNPPHTAIFPQPYSYLNQREDYSLGPGGDLRTYLERLAAADDVQSFVRDNPFGQPSITESDPHWNFYAQIADKVQKPLA